MSVRLAPDFEYHATSLRAHCLRPMYFKQEHPELEAPGSLKALRGTIGHAITSGIHGGSIKFGASDREYADIFLQIVNENVYDLCDESKGCDIDGSGRTTFLLEDPADVRKWATSEMDSVGLILQQYCRWWRINMRMSPTEGVLAIEAPYRMELGGEGKAKPYIVTGMIDLLYEHDDLGKCLLDWKWGEYQRSHESQTTLDMDYQLCTYALACREAVIEGVENFVPDTVGWLFMGDLEPYTRKTPISHGSYPTNARRMWIDQLLKSGRVAHAPGDLRGPVLHDTHYTNSMLDQHKYEMIQRMAATRMGGALVRVRGENCSWCFWRDACLEEWKR